MANPALRPGALAKPSKAARLRLDALLEKATRGQLAKLYAYVYHRDGYRCVACKQKVDPKAPDALKRAHPHHLVRRSKADRASKHTKAGIVTLCPFCHADVTEHRVVITGNAETRLTITRMK